MRLVDTTDEQALLEDVLEQSKPKLPANALKLHYLLATPFRYRPREGSRFRAPFESGVWYGAEALRTSLAEKSYWRLRFLLDSPGTPDLRPVPHTAFRATASGKCIDLTTAPFAADRAQWVHRTSYTATQAFSALVRAADIAIIRYESVRDPEHGMCAAVLTPAAFARSKPRKQETWFIVTSRERVRCVRQERGGDTYEFTATQLLGEAG